MQQHTIHNAKKLLSIDGIAGPGLNPARNTRLSPVYFAYGACLGVVLLGCVSVGNTISSYFDSEISPANIFTAGVWGSNQHIRVGQDAPLVLELSAPQEFTLLSEDPPDDPPPEGPTDDPPLVEVSEPVTVIVDSPSESPAEVTPPADTPPEIPDFEPAQ